VHDHWKPYESIEGSFEHAFCNAHHLRELRRASEQDHQQWSEDMSNLLMLAHHKVNHAKTNQKEALSHRKIKQFNMWYDAIVQSASVYHPQSDSKKIPKKRKSQTDLC
jgi:transposase